MIYYTYSVDKVPTWALSYLINNDASSLNEDEKKSVDLYKHRVECGVKSVLPRKLHSIIYDVEDYSYFSSRNDVSPYAGEVADCYVSGVFHD